MFVYVMDLDSKNVLEKHGFQLIRKDEHSGMWIFENKGAGVADFSLDIPCVVTDVLAF